MKIPFDVHQNRTHIFFFLILSVAVLWAVFLLQQREFLQFSFMFALIAAINPLVAFVDIRNNGEPRTLFIFYILILVALIWAAFLLYLGVLLWISLFLFIIAVGIPVIIQTKETKAEYS